MDISSFSTLQTTYFKKIALTILIMLLAAWGIFFIKDENRIPQTLIPLIIGFLPLCLVFVYKFPNILCLLSIVLIYFRFPTFVYFILPLHIPLLIILSVSLSLIVNIYFKKIKLGWSFENKACAAIIVLIFLGIIFAYNPSVALAEGRAIAPNAFLLFFLFNILLKRKDFIWLHRLIFLSGIVLIYYTLSRAGHTLYNRLALEGDLSDPNLLATVLLFILSACGATLFMSKDILSRLLSIIMIFITLYIIYMTRSRGGMMAIFPIFFIVGYYKTNSKISFSVIYWIIALLLYAIYYEFNKDARIDLVNSVGLDPSAQSRLDLWKSGLLMALRHPLLGVGLNNFSLLSYNYLPTVGDEINLEQHSYWIGVLCESGFPSFAIHVVLIVNGFFVLRQALKKLYSESQRDNQMITVVLGLFAAYVSYWVSVTFLPEQFSGQSYLLIGLSIALKRCLNSENRQFNPAPPPQHSSPP